MKKKTVTLSLAGALAATTLIGGTMAYFTDTDQATNTFTYGNVEIDLVEIGKNGEDFFDEENDKTLIPGSKTVNQVVKQVSVKNTGDNDAYMWIEVWIPDALDEGNNTSLTAPESSLHFEYGTGVTQTKYGYLGQKMIGAVKYNGYLHYVKDETTGIKPMKSTIDLLDLVYMDSGVEQCTDTQHTNCLVLTDGTHYTGPWELVIEAIGFQSDGIGTIEEAIDLWYDNDKEISDYIRS